MPRELKPCGTYAAYRRHLRRHESVDAACRKASRVQKNSRTSGARQTSAELLTLAIAKEPAVELVDELQETLENLRIVRAAMASASASAIASLSKRRDELTQRAIRLQAAAKPKGNALDDLARRRAERLASTAN